jgi:pSer/pThr/pTyr-binding forkhead associated (FHA) protein
VPINGPQSFKTFKLLAGVTKVGNVPGAHIQFDDAFMSAEHAHIVMTPNGFTLMDNNATNGTFVNEKRLSGKHELVDNDMVMFGKTSCKFKTIVGLG